jgi:hypothetical protein
MKRLVLCCCTFMLFAAQTERSQERLGNYQIRVVPDRAFRSGRLEPLAFDRD